MENKNGGRVNSQQTISGARQEGSAVSKIIMMEMGKSEQIKDPVVLTKSQWYLT